MRQADGGELGLEVEVAGGDLNHRTGMSGLRQQKLAAGPQLEDADQDQRADQELAASDEQDAGPERVRGSPERHVELAEVHQWLDDKSRRDRQYRQPDLPDLPLVSEETGHQPADQPNRQLTGSSISAFVTLPTMTKS